MTQAYQIPDPRCDDGSPKYLVISPQSIRVEHSERGLIQEVFFPEGVEVNLECYTCPNPECDCPDDYYLDLSIKIPKAEYDRISSLPGWAKREIG